MQPLADLVDIGERLLRPRTRPSDTIEERVVSVSDGDTITMLDRSKQQDKGCLGIASGMEAGV